LLLLGRDTSRLIASLALEDESAGDPLRA
jgi:hypothetical protein